MPDKLYRELLKSLKTRNEGKSICEESNQIQDAFKECLSKLVQITREELNDQSSTFHRTFRSSSLYNEYKATQAESNSNCEELCNGHNPFDESMQMSQTNGIPLTPLPLPVLSQYNIPSLIDIPQSEAPPVLDQNPPTQLPPPIPRRPPPLHQTQPSPRPPSRPPPTPPARRSPRPPKRAIGAAINSVKRDQLLNQIHQGITFRQTPTFRPLPLKNEQLEKSDIAKILLNTMNERRLSLCPENDELTEDSNNDDCFSD